MKLEQIQRQSVEEGTDILPYLNFIVWHVKRFPEGSDIFVPQKLIPKLEEYCDSNLIPFYAVCENTCSIAASYTQLLSHETLRQPTDCEELEKLR